MRQDYLLDENLDLIIRNGDLAVGNSDQNHKLVHLLASKGHVRQYVKIGAGVYQELNGIMGQNLQRTILQSFKLDGYDLRGIDIVDNEIIIK